MEALTIVILGLLGLLAIFDLYVGVSNDAVNFLNSAVGSRTAPFRIILCVAGAGVLLGATFSSGMMDIAKTGILVPSRFSYEEVMIIFAAVMVTDVLLLNLFNVLGLPTSTTVSIVFELLGGTLALAFAKIWHGGLPAADLAQYVNSGKALSMILAILVSVIVAFIAGIVVQFILRLIFSFNYARIYRWIGGLYGSLCISAIFYYLIVKGAKGASFVTPDMLAFINTYTMEIMATVFVASYVVMQALAMAGRNIFPFVILSGTFALAFAFAGNDLVNFVGVPLAALDAYHIFSGSGATDEATFMMGGLAESTQTASGWLLLSGLVMVATLFMSKKARRVILTSVNLSASSRGGKEQFGSSMPARVLVRSSIRFTQVVEQFLPRSILRGINHRFEPYKLQPGERERAFDELRASVNLVLAAGLIASATSLKLPLSTTYVTFMVAMGSSLADGAWDRESAVYRVSGVLTVISGWFLTAFTAASACGLVVFLFMWGGKIVTILAMLIAMAILIKSNFMDHEETAQLQEEEKLERGTRSSIAQVLAQSVAENQAQTLRISTAGIDALLNQDDQTLKHLRSEALQLFENISNRRGDYYIMSRERHETKADRDARNFFYRAFSNMKEVSHGLRDQIGISENYVANSHSALTGAMRQDLFLICSELKRLNGRFRPEDCRNVYELLDRAQNNFLVQSAEEDISLRKSELYLGKLLFVREMMSRYAMVQMLLDEMGIDKSQKVTPAGVKVSEAPTAS